MGNRASYEIVDGRPEKRVVVKTIAVGTFMTALNFTFGLAARDAIKTSFDLIMPDKQLLSLYLQVLLLFSVIVIVSAHVPRHVYEH